MTHLFYYHDYLAIASPPGCGREHFAALVEIARQQEERARKVAEVKAVPRLDAIPAKPRRQRKPRRPSIKTMIEQAEKTGKTVTSVTTPDGTIINFGEPEPATLKNPWPLDEFRTKETKQ